MDDKWRRSVKGGLRRGLEGPRLKRYAVKVIFAAALLTAGSIIAEKHTHRRSRGMPRASCGPGADDRKGRKGDAASDKRRPELQPI